MLLLVALARVDPALVIPGSAFRRLLETFVFLNVLLAFFNALPVPSLDGSRVVDALVPSRLERAWSAFNSLGLGALVAVWVLSIMLGAPLFAWPLEQTQALLQALLPIVGP